MSSLLPNISTLIFGNTRMSVTKQAIECQIELPEVLVQISGHLFLWNCLEGEKTDTRVSGTQTHT